MTNGRKLALYCVLTPVVGVASFWISFSVGLYYHFGRFENRDAYTYPAATEPYQVFDYVGGLGGDQHCFLGSKATVRVVQRKDGHVLCEVTRNSSESRGACRTGERFVVTESRHGFSVRNAERLWDAYRAEQERQKAEKAFREDK